VIVILRYGTFKYSSSTHVLRFLPKSVLRSPFIRMRRFVVWKRGAKISKKKKHVAAAFRIENGSCYIQEDRHLK